MAPPRFLAHDTWNSILYDLKSAVKFREDRFPIPADGNTADFGGGLNHHLRDFAHHPTVVGLLFSLRQPLSGSPVGLRGVKADRFDCPDQK